MVITGPKRAVERVVLENGRLRTDGTSYSGRRLKITITAPDVRKFDISGDSELTVEDYRQDSLDIDASQVKGSFTVDADSSGSIQVSDVGGDFTVSNDGSGGVRYEKVAGRVSVPQR